MFNRVYCLSSWLGDLLLLGFGVDVEEIQGKVIDILLNDFFPWLLLFFRPLLQVPQILALYKAHMVGLYVPPNELGDPFVVDWEIEELEQSFQELLVVLFGPDVFVILMENIRSFTYGCRIVQIL